MNLIDLICFVTAVCLMNYQMNRQSVVVFFVCVVCVCVCACIRAHIPETLLQAVIQHHFYCTQNKVISQKD